MDKEKRIVIIVLEGPQKGEKFLVESDRAIIGSSGDIQLIDDSIAPHHARISKKENKIFIQKLSASHKLQLNDRDVLEDTLSSMDEVTIGNTRLLLSITDPLPPQELTDTMKLPPSEERAKTSPDENQRQKPARKSSRKEFVTRRMDKKDERSSHPYLEITLKVLSGKLKSQKYTFSQPIVVIGRTIGDVLIDDQDISRKHCSLEIQGRDRVFIHDHASTNGTYINQNRVSYMLVKNGDLLEVGNASMTIWITKKSDE